MRMAITPAPGEVRARGITGGMAPRDPARPGGKQGTHRTHRPPSGRADPAWGTDQVISEARPQQRFGVTVAVAGDLPPQRDGVADRRPDRARRAVELLGVVGVRQVLEDRPEEADVVAVRGQSEGPL